MYVTILCTHLKSHIHPSLDHKVYDDVGKCFTITFLTTKINDKTEKSD